MSPNETVYHYPAPNMAEVYGTLAYVWDHWDEIECSIAGEVG
jgi:hypothetical protein